ncbi:C45 family autoproteolytic acyltransferase/hydolase [Ruegeria profundi]|uniref:Uncharacterized protein n=1 Tax=Ruegeria profundi TaxID=1685378 RepID=A0A0X3TDV1_9RHOB|nr:C45 family peptidase [Ruegeria profundi]KUJ73291.1 hypothetical protein AVO44_20180 [Ruegeria profundi]
MKLAAEHGGGKLYDTEDSDIRLMTLSGSWHEMGVQYGTLAKADMEPMWDALVAPMIKNGWTTEEDARELWGKNIYERASRRKQQFFDGLAEGMGWPVDKVVLLDQGGIMAVYQAKMHSFSGCSSLYASGAATVDGNTYVARNMDWGEEFCNFKTYCTVFNPVDGSNSVASVTWPGWTFPVTAINDKGVYVDMHDGTSMGGQVIAAARPCFEHRVFDFLCDGDSTSAVSARFGATRVEFPSIWGIADASGDKCSYETTLYDSRRRLPDGDGDVLAVVNTFLNQDWGLHIRDTISNSLTRYKNVEARAADSHGKLDAAKMREIFELTLFNEDGSFRENGGPTKPKKQDADLTNYTIAADLNNLQLWVRLPPSNGEWQHFDLKALFA